MFCDAGMGRDRLAWNAQVTQIELAISSSVKHLY